MYKIGSVGPAGPRTSLHATASDAMAAIHNLCSTHLGDVTITDAAGKVLSEIQLAMLVLIERQMRLAASKTAQ